MLLDCEQHDEEKEEEEEKLVQDRLIEVGHLNVVVDAFKKSEDGKGYLLRVHEKSGDYFATKIKFSPDLKIKRAVLCNSLENTDEES